MSLKFTRPKSEAVRLELAPLIDVIFQLLIFFMISSSFLYPSLSINLPKIETPEPSDQHQELVLSVAKGGNYFLNGEPTQKESLPGALKQALESNDRKSLFFHADNSIPYQQVVEVMNLANAAGAQQFNFIYEDTH